MSRSNLIASGEERGGYVQEDPERACVLPEDPCGVSLPFFIRRRSICVQALSEEAQHLITALLVKVKLSLICWVRKNAQRSPTKNLIHIDQEPVDRLGTVAEGRDDGSKDDQESLKSHDFFKEIDWTAVEEVETDQ